MNGRDLILILAHLFRTFGPEVSIEDAVEFLSFKCHYGPPLEIRKALSMALQKEMISKKGNTIRASFIYDTQRLTVGKLAKLENRIRVDGDFQPMY